MVVTLKGLPVLFASVTKEGGHKNGKHLLAVVIDKKTKKDLLAKADSVWAENKTAKAKDPVHSITDGKTSWFSKEDDGRLILWLTKKADGKPATFKIADPAMTGEMFTDFGEGSEVDVEFDIYYFNSSEHGEMLSRSFNAIKLNKYVPYEGGGSTLEGDTVTVGKGKDNGYSAEVKSDDSVEKFEKAISKGKFEKAEELLEDLEDHADYKKFKKALKKAKKAV